MLFEGRWRLASAAGEVLLASGDGGVAVAGGRRGARLSRGRAMRSPGRSTIRRSWRLWRSAQQSHRCRRACSVPWSGRPPTTTPARWRRSTPCPRPSARRPLLHLSRGRAAQRRPGRRGRGRARAGAGARARGRQGAGRAGGDRGRAELEEAALADARRAVELAPTSAPARIALSYALQGALSSRPHGGAARGGGAHARHALVFARLAEIESPSATSTRPRRRRSARSRSRRGPARTQMVLGFTALTRIEITEAKAAFERAI